MSRAWRLLPPRLHGTAWLRSGARARGPVVDWPQGALHRRRTPHSSGPFAPCRSRHQPRGPRPAAAAVGCSGSCRLSCAARSARHWATRSATRPAILDEGSQWNWTAMPTWPRATAIQEPSDSPHFTSVIAWAPDDVHGGTSMLQLRPVLAPHEEVFASRYARLVL